MPPSTLPNHLFCFMYLASVEVSGHNTPRFFLFLFEFVARFSSQSYTKGFFFALYIRAIIQEHLWLLHLSNFQYLADSLGIEGFLLCYWRKSSLVLIITLGLDNPWSVSACVAAMFALSASLYFCAVNEKIETRGPLVHGSFSLRIWEGMWTVV